jgi:hypothetical protein
MSDDLYDGPCEAGCISFYGGERKHHKDCGHYPHSLTKVNADRIEELEAKLAKAVEALEYYAAPPPPPDVDDSLLARAALAELKGEDRG